MREEPRKLRSITAGAAAAFAVAVLAVYPLYIDKFSNLGVTKYTGVFTLFLLCAAAVGACMAVGGRAAPGRYAGARRDGTLWGLAAFAGATVLATVLSLSPLASLFGLGGYYGGLSLVLFGTMGYFCLRSCIRVQDLDILWACVSVTVILVTLFYLLNIFNIDLLGAYGDTAVVERAQFFSTLGQKDFNAGYLSIALPIAFYFFMEADGRAAAAVRGIPAVAGALALAIVDSDGLLLGVGTALCVLICRREFTTKQLRRIAFLGAAFFAWDAFMFHMRATVYTQGGTPLLAKFGAPARAVPGMVLCAGLWLALWALRRGKAELPLWLGGRILTAAALAGAGIGLAAVNLVPGFPSLGTLDNFFRFNDDWGTYRGTAWRAAFGAWWEAPLWRKLFGYGPGMMHSAVQAWAGDAYTARMKTFYAAHNEYLEQLLTTGLAGLAGWVWFAAAHLKRGFRNWARPGAAPILLALCSYLAQAVVSIRVSMIFPEVLLLFALLAACTAPEEPALQAAEKATAAKAGRRHRAARPAAAGETPRRRAAYCLGVAAAGVLAMVLAAPLSRLLFGFLLG